MNEAAIDAIDCELEGKSDLPSEEDNDGIWISQEKSKTYYNGDVESVYSFKHRLLAHHVLVFARMLARNYDDELEDVLWVELGKGDPAVSALAHGADKVGLVSPADRGYEAFVLVDAAKAAWFDLRKTRARITFDFEAQTITVEEFARKYPECSNGDPCAFRYFEDKEGNLYKFNATYNSWFHVFPDAVLVEMAWSDREGKIAFVGTLKPVEDSGCVEAFVSFHKDSDDIDAEGLTFCAQAPDGGIREYQGLLKCQSEQSGSFILFYTNIPRHRHEKLKSFASIYDPLEWRALGDGGSAEFTLRALSDPKDWAFASKIAWLGEELATLDSLARKSDGLSPRWSLASVLDYVRFRVEQARKGD